MPVEGIFMERKWLVVVLEETSQGPNSRSGGLPEKKWKTVDYQGA